MQDQGAEIYGPYRIGTGLVRDLTPAMWPLAHASGFGFYAFTTRGGTCHLPGLMCSKQYCKLDD